MLWHVLEPAVKSHLRTPQLLSCASDGDDAPEYPLALRKYSTIKNSLDRQADFTHVVGTCKFGLQSDLG